MQHLDTHDLALAALDRAWPQIVEECLAVLGSELHYQAVIYHCLRSTGVPTRQLGMNVKMWLEDPVTPLFQTLDARKHEDFRGGFEPIPDVVVFGPGIDGDWRRRNYRKSLEHALLAIEIKASERRGKRLTKGEIIADIGKLVAHRDEALHRGVGFIPVMLVVDSASEPQERMLPAALDGAREVARAACVSFYYLAPDEALVDANQARSQVVPAAMDPARFERA